MTNSNKNLISPTRTCVMILAAGEGKRMLPLSKDTPKPLLKIGEHSLLEHHLLRLQSLGFKEVVINTAYLGSMIRDQIGSGSKFNLNIQYSDESQTGALETAGGIAKALPLISSDPFIVINSDIWTDFDFSSLLKPLEPQGAEQRLGRLVLVENPHHNQAGDFNIDHNNQLSLIDQNTYNTFTFSGIALYKKSIFTDLKSGKQALAPILKKMISHNALTPLIHCGDWTDVGTPQRLNLLNQIVIT